MLKKYKDWALDDLKEVIEWVEEIETRFHIEATLTTTKSRLKDDNIQFTFMAVIEKSNVP